MPEIKSVSFESTTQTPLSGAESQRGQPTIRPSLLADRPVSDPKCDRLGRFEFSRSLASSIVGLKGQDSIVVGLCGPWGSGKTSVLNFLEGELTNCALEDRPLVFHFNPWWFSGQDRLLQAFLEQLGVTLNRADRGKPLKRVSALLGHLSTALKPVALIPIVGEYAKFAQEVAAAGSEGAKSCAEAMQVDLSQLRKEIDELLRQVPNRIVIVIDDIDRLAATEIAQLFAILKAVADFPNTVYVLAYDERVVRSAVRTAMGVSGKAYLDKVVQLRIDLPIPANDAIYNLFIEQLVELLGEDRPSLDGNCTDFWNLFYAGIKGFLTTPRAVIRLMNVLRFTYPPLRGEVHWPDLVGVGCLMTFAPQVVRTITRHPDRFIGFVHDPEDRKSSEAFHKAWLSKVEGNARTEVEGIIRRLFPRVETALGGSRYGRDWEVRWRSLLLVRSETHFEKYFRLCIPAGSMGETEWRESLSDLPDPIAFSQRLLDACGHSGRHGHTRACQALDRLQDFVRVEASSEQAAQVFGSVLTVGDRLIAASDKEQLVDNSLRLIWLFQGCLLKVSAPERICLLDEAVKVRGGLVTICELVVALGYEHGMFSTSKAGQPPHENPLIDQSEVQRLADCLIREIESAAELELAENPLFMKVVGRWRQLGHRDAATEWLQRFIDSDENLVRVIRAMTGEIRTQSVSDYVSVKTPTVACEYLAEFISPATLKQRSESILSSDHPWLTPDDRNGLRLVSMSIGEYSTVSDPGCRK